MALIEELELINYRNYAHGRFRFSGDQVVLAGPNGSGKTNLLEGIFFLSILRSFRTVSVRELIRIGERAFTLEAKIDRGPYHETLRVHQAGVDRRETFIGGNRVRRASEFIREFRAVVFVPEDRNTTSGSSLFRRRFFDMLISTLDPGYLTTLADYQRALAQRNRALKFREKARVAAAFEPELAKHAPEIARKRREFALRVEGEIARMLSLDDGFELAIRHRGDYPGDPAAYLEELERRRERELGKGFTSIGPQLDDFELLLNGKLLRHYGSTGQIRIVSLLLKLAEFNLIRQSGEGRVAVLVDDVTGELDERNRHRFFTTIAGADQQFFTFTEPPGDEMFKEAELIRF